MSPNNLITVNVRSHVAPSADIEGFKIGKPFLVRVESNSTVEALLQQLFYNNMRHLGLIVLNGKVAAKDRVLFEGDALHIYNLILGG